MDHNKYFSTVVLTALLLVAALLAAAPAAHAQTAGDTDGDGVPDVEEMNSYALLINASFEDGVDPGVATNRWGSAPRQALQFWETQIPGWSTTEGPNRIEIWQSGFNSTPSQHGSNHAEINANEHATLYQDIRTQPGTTLEWSIWHRGRAGTDHAVALVGDASGPLSELPVEVYMSTGNTAWVQYSGTYVVPAGQTRTRLAFRSISTATGNLSVGNFIDNLEVNVLVARDSDGDGAPDHLDTDSDNDGISDGDEAKEDRPDEVTFNIPDAGIPVGDSCGFALDSDRLPRQAVAVGNWAPGATVLSTGFDGSYEWMQLSGSWEQRGSALRQLRNCGYDHTALLDTAPIADFTFEVSVRAVDGTNGGGIVFNQSSPDTRSGAMVVHLIRDGAVLAWGRYDHAGYYRSLGRTPVSSGGTDTIAVTQQAGSVEISFNGEVVGTTTASNPGGYVGFMSSLSSVAFDHAALTAA
ncbi:MAG: hypothetical protein AAF567_24615 [Actinomycetota bacterium]